jgi:hypothetical protein
MRTYFIFGLLKIVRENHRTGKSGSPAGQLAFHDVKTPALFTENIDEGIGDLGRRSSHLGLQGAGMAAQQVQLLVKRLLQRLGSGSRGLLPGFGNGLSRLGVGLGSR